MHNVIRIYFTAFLVQSSVFVQWNLPIFLTFSSTFARLLDFEFRFNICDLDLTLDVYI